MSDYQLLTVNQLEYKKYFLIKKRNALFHSFWRSLLTPNRRKKNLDLIHKQIDAINLELYNRDKRTEKMLKYLNEAKELLKKYEK